MIEMRGVTVRYGHTVAVDDVTLRLPADKIYGLLGRNGSGKTSLLSALTSYRKPSAGTVLIDGVPAFENPEIARRSIFLRDALDLQPSDRIRCARSTPTLRTLSWPIPSVSAPFSTEECVCSEI